MDFEFSPATQVFLHFLFSLINSMTRKTLYNLFYEGDHKEWNLICKEIMGQIIVACNRCDHQEGGEVQMLKTLFNLHDAQGRTFLHIYYGKGYRGLWLDITLSTMKSSDISLPIPPATIAECLNAMDASDCTLLHITCIHDSSHVNEKIFYGGNGF